MKSAIKSITTWQVLDPIYRSLILFFVIWDIIISLGVILPLQHSLDDKDFYTIILPVVSFFSLIAVLGSYVCYKILKSRKNRLAKIKQSFDTGKIVILNVSTVGSYRSKAVLFKKGYLKEIHRITYNLITKPGQKYKCVSENFIGNLDKNKRYECFYELQNPYNNVFFADNLNPVLSNLSLSLPQLESTFKIPKSRFQYYRSKTSIVEILFITLIPSVFLSIGLGPAVYSYLQGENLSTMEIPLCIFSVLFTLLGIFSLTRTYKVISSKLEKYSRMYDFIKYGKHVKATVIEVDENIKYSRQYQYVKTMLTYSFNDFNGKKYRKELVLETMPVKPSKLFLGCELEVVCNPDDFNENYWVEE